MLDDPKYTDFINKLVEIGVIDSADNLDDIALAFNSVSTEAQDASDSVNDFSDGKTITTMAEAWKQLKASTDDSTKGVADALTALADKGELTIKTFSETDGAKNYFDGLSMSAEEAVNYINSLSDKNSQLGQMSKNIQDITGALGTKLSDGIVSVDDFTGFDATIKGLDSWDEFTKLLGDSSSSMAECQEAANKLATEYVNENATLSLLNDSNREYYEAQLSKMGITNATAVVEAALAKNLGEEKVATEEAIKAGLNLNDVKITAENATDLFANATVSEIAELAKEAQQSGVSAQALALLGLYEIYDTYSDITDCGAQYNEDVNQFVDCLAVRLTKSNLAEQVQSLQDIVSPVIDFNTMSDEEIKTYKKGVLNNTCTAEISKGIQIETDRGTETFSLEQHDQNNISSLCLTAMQNPAVAYLPYHSNGNECRMFPAKVIISLYLQMQLKITQETTKCNLLRVQLDGETDRDTIMSYTYDTPLNESYQAQYNEIIANTLEIIQGLIAGFMNSSGTTDESDNTPDTDTSTSESGDSDGENTETTTEDTTAN